MSPARRQDRPILVLDVGKTNTRLVLCDREGRTLHCVSRTSETRPGPPYPHLPVDETFEWLLDAIRDLDAPSLVESIVPVAHGATAALLDAEDELVLPVLDYEWSGIDAIGSSYDRPPFAETRSPALPAGLNLGRQLCYQAQAYPDAWVEARTILLYPQYWAWRLSGTKASELTSLGCHTDLWNPETGSPSRLWRKSASRSAPSLTQLPPLRSAWSSLGPPRAEVRARTGLPGDCRVLCGVHDSNAAYLAHRAGRDAPFTVVSSGTWVVLMAHGADLTRLDADRDMLANVDVFGDPVATARFMGGREFEVIVGDTASAPPASLRDAESVIARGALALPSPVERGGPLPGHRGASCDTEELSPSERVAVASLYLALQTDASLDLLAARGDLVVEGPLAKNDVFLAALAAFRPDQPLHRSADETGSVRGATALALWPNGRGCDVATRVRGTSIAGLGVYRDRWRDRARSRGGRAGGPWRG